MSRGFNKIVIMGNLARDPDVRHTPSKQKVARFTVAVGREWKDKVSGEKKSQTDFIPVVAWTFLADLADNYLRKGKPVLVEGRLQVREYEDSKTGGRRWATEVIAENITMLPSGGRDQSAPAGSSQPYGRRNDNLPGAYGQDVADEPDFPLDFSELGDDEVEVPF